MTMAKPFHPLPASNPEFSRYPQLAKHYSRRYKPAATIRSWERTQSQPCRISALFALLALLVSPFNTVWVQVKNIVKSK